MVEARNIYKGLTAKNFMRKLIYSETRTENGPRVFNSLNPLNFREGEHGLFEYLNFRNYMETLGEVVGSCAANGGEDSVQIYHVDGITIQHAYSKEGQVTLNLYGSSKESDWKSRKNHP